MFDFAWSEILLIAVVALVVIGPKDLPRVMRTLGVWMGRARSIAREFQGSLEQMVREAELEDIRKEVEQTASIDLKKELETSIDPSGELQRSLTEPIVPTAPSSTAPTISSETPPPPAEAIEGESPTAPLPAPEAEAPPTAAKSGTHA